MIKVNAHLEFLLKSGIVLDCRSNECLSLQDDFDMVVSKVELELKILFPFCFVVLS